MKIKRIDHGGIAIACPIAPYAASRADVRASAQDAGATFVLVHVATPLEVCEARDRKGLDALARAGRIPEFTGISDPYEAPTDADLVLDTSTVPVPDGVEQILAVLPPASPALGPEALDRSGPTIEQVYDEHLVEEEFAVEVSYEGTIPLPEDVLKDGSQLDSRFGAMGGWVASTLVRLGDLKLDFLPPDQE